MVPIRDLLGFCLKTQFIVAPDALKALLVLDQQERTKQIEPILRAKVKKFFKTENLKKNILIYMMGI